MVGQVLGLQKKPAPGFIVAVAEADRIQRQPLFDGTGILIVYQLVEKTAGLACISGDFGQTFFSGIQLFQYHHGDKDIMFLKAEQGRGIVH